MCVLTVIIERIYFMKLFRLMIRRLSCMYLQTFIYLQTFYVLLTLFTDRDFLLLVTFRNVNKTPLTKKRVVFFCINIVDLILHPYHTLIMD